jgi:chemotaxis protein MotB
MTLINEAMEKTRANQKEKKDSWIDELIHYKGIDVDFRGEETVLHVSSKLLFDSGSAEIHIEGLELLLWMSDSLRDLPYSIEVGGHTDNLSISTKRFPSNWELSLARSVNVVKFLEGAGRIPGSRLAASGYADSKPLVSNNTAEGRAKNRRVEIVLKENE